MSYPKAIRDKNAREATYHMVIELDYHPPKDLEGPYDPERFAQLFRDSLPDYFLADNIKVVGTQK